MFHYSSLFLLGKPCCSQTLGQEKYRSHKNCVNGTKTGTYHNTQMIKSATLDLKLRSFFIPPSLLPVIILRPFFNLLTPKISKSRVVFGCQTFLVIVALVNWVFNQGMSRSLSSCFFFSSPFLLTIYIDFVRMNSSFVTTWSNMVYRVSGITPVMIMISISTSFARECKCSWREVEGRRTFQQ